MSDTFGRCPFSPSMIASLDGSRIELRALAALDTTHTNDVEPFVGDAFALARAIGAEPRTSSGSWSERIGPTQGDQVKVGKTPGDAWLTARRQRARLNRVGSPVAGDVSAHRPRRSRRMPSRCTAVVIEITAFVPTGERANRSRRSATSAAPHSLAAERRHRRRPGMRPTLVISMLAGRRRLGQSGPNRQALRAGSKPERSQSQPQLHHDEHGLRT